MSGNKYSPPSHFRWRKRGASLQDAVERFFGRNHLQERFHLLHLWDNWPMVMGDEIAPLAQPLGAKGGTLIIGAEDNMLLHELSFYAQEILARANAFMNAPKFSQVRLELLQGRRPLYPRGLEDRGQVNLPDERQRPKKLGGLKDKIDPNSPAGRAYLAYVQSFEDDE